MSGITLALATTGKELFKKLFLDLCNYCVSAGLEKFSSWANAKKIEAVYKKITQIRKIKTIWQVDKAVDLASFYCDSHVIVGKNRKLIKRVSDLGKTENVIIQGIAGQGKSVLLRFLCASELLAGEYFPVFVELRRVSSETPLIERILSSFLSLGLTIDESHFRSLASTGKILLLLDAFDEVSDAIKPKVLTDIEDLASAYEGLRIIVTSRPNHNIQVSSFFSVVTLDNLQNEEYKFVIHKLFKDQVAADNLIKHIEEKANHVIGLLCTPLMVTLLVLSYKSYQKLPTKLSEFYDTLFQTLLSRHDGSKPGFTRQRCCNLDDSQIRDAFEALCILAKKKGSQSFTLKSIQNIAKQAIELVNLNESHNAFIDDIVRITCLINKDGEEHRFIHKTVQEFFTASFIQKKPEQWAKEFYQRLLNPELNGSWWQELEFLAEIDSYRHNRFFYIPLLLKRINRSESDLLKPWVPFSLNEIAEIFDKMYFLRPSKELSEIRVLFGGKQIHLLLLDILLKHAPFNNEEISLAFEKISIDSSAISQDAPELMSQEKGIQDGKLICISQAISDELFPTLVEIVQKKVKMDFDEAIRLKKMVENEECPSILDGLI